MALLPIALLVLAAAVIAALAGFGRDMAAARARLAAFHPRLVETALGPIEIAETGVGPPVLVIHGASGGYDQGLEMTAALAPRGWRLIAPSRFGYLGSPMPPAPTPEAQADVYAALLDALGFRSAVVVAISAGAWSALRFAERHGDRCRALILLVPAGHLPPGQANHGGAFVRAIIGSDLFAWAMVRLMRLAPGPMARQMLGADPALVAAAPPAERARIDAILAHLLPVAPRRAGMMADIAVAADRAADFGGARLASPLLTVSAEDDPFRTAERARRLAGEAADGEALVFASGGHPLVGRHDEALDAVAAFLDARVRL